MRKTRVLSWLLVGVLTSSLAVTLSLETAPSAHAQATGAVQLGGMDLMSYCRSLGYVSVRTIGTTYYSWRCIDRNGNDVPFSMQAVCQWQYHTPDAWDRTDNFYSATGGQCDQGHMLGGMNLKGYCKSLGYVDVTLRGSTANDWYCLSGSFGNTVHISWDFEAGEPDMHDACFWMYNTFTLARFADFYTATSGQCIG